VEKYNMATRPLMLAACLVLLSAPAIAAQDESEVRRSKNGDFLFKHYPARALALGEQGRVGFRVTLDDEGTVTSCDVTKSSGFGSLDSETCDLIVQYARFKPVRDVAGRTFAAMSEGFVNWRLPRGAVPNVTQASSKVGLNPEKIVCRKSVRTGSLVATERLCLTRREWSRAESQAKERLHDVQGKGSSWDGMDGGD
jgi:TonB family protein